MEQPHSPINLGHAYSELEFAGTAITHMKSAEDFREFEYHWKAFLTAIERVWIKAERACQPVLNSFARWQGSYTRLRRKDPLLRYLKHARDADTHTVAEIIQQHPGEISIHPDPTGRSASIRNLQVWPDGSWSAETFGGKPDVRVILPHIKLVRFKEGNDWYNPPTMHLDKQIVDQAAIEIAVLGYDFYRSFLNALADKYRNPAV
jgi:hypothetical protein